MAAIVAGFTTVTTPGKAVPLATGSVPVPANWITFWPRVVSGTSNTGEVRVGGPTVNGAIPSGTGGRMSPGDSSVAWPHMGGSYDLRTVYVDGDSGGDGVQWICGV